MNVTRKLLIAFSVLVALVLITNTASLFIIHSLSGELGRAADITARSQYLAGEVDTSAAEMLGLERAAALDAVLGDKSRAARYREDFDRTAASLQKALAELHKTASNAEAVSLLASLDQQAVAAVQAHQELQRAIGNDKLDAALSIFSVRVAPCLEQIGRQASALVEQQNRELQTASHSAEARSSTSIGIMLGLMVLAVCAGGAVYWIVVHTNRSLLRFSHELAERSQQVASAACQVSAAGQSLAEGASEQAASLEETSASTEEIASITRQNAEHALQVAGIMQKSAAGAGEVNEMLDRMVEKMKEIDGSSQKIARIIKVIDEIAFQTNILALNAAVEAARAGEAGLGFAVVADEVRNLAQRCAQAARDTAALIEESIATSQDGNQRLDRMAGAVRAMTESSLHVKSLVDEVNQGSQEQSRGMDQIARTVLHMDQVTQKTAESARQSASAGSQLSEHAASLSALVDEMREVVG